MARIDKPAVALSRVVEVKSYRTRDGKLFDRYSDADAHAATCEFIALLDACGVGRGGEWDADMIARAILERAAEFRDCLIAICGDTQ